MNKSSLKINTKYSFIKVMTGSDLSSRNLALLKMKSPNPGPVVWLTACVHGNEVGGIVIVQEVFKKLRATGILKGTIYAFPLMNPIGFETLSRGIVLSKEDLNRSFPGNPKGTLAERIAETIFTNIKKTNPTLVLDLHNDWRNSIPYTLIDPYPGVKHKDAYEKVKLYSQQTGFIIINEEEENLTESEELRKTLSGSLLLQNIPSLTLEVGGSDVVNEKDVEMGVKSVFNLLSYLGMVVFPKNNFIYHIPDFLKGKILKYSHQPLCSSSGIIRFLVKPGEIVKAGQPVARIYNVFGRLQETPIAPYDSIILGHSDSSVALPGLEIVACGRIK